MTYRSMIRALPKHFIFAILLALAAFAPVAAQGVKRVVMVKIDGLPGYLVDKYVKEIDPATGKSRLPWIEESFYKNGTRLDNFYTRGMSLSGPSWGTIDTGQHLQIKGNVEYDRYTLHAYDYLNFIPFYINFGLKKVADMPAVEVMDQVQTPLLVDMFAYDRRYLSPQLYQRSHRWQVIGSGFINLYPGSPSDMIDEWTMGLDLFGMTMRQNERDIVDALVNQPNFDYLDYYEVSFDHIAHGNNDPKAQLADLKKLDRTIGRFWTAIKQSSRADETAMVLISDHGFNSQDKVYSQGFNLVKLLNRRNAGGHHVVTKRRLMTDYSVNLLYPIPTVIGSASDESLYLKGQMQEYPTALFDFDGNERSSVQLRNSELNVLHILLGQLQRKGLSPDIRRAATNEFFRTIDANRSGWQTTITELTEELAALQRSIGVQEKGVAEYIAKLKPQDDGSGMIVHSRRLTAHLNTARQQETEYRQYVATLQNLLGLRRDTFDPKKVKIKDVIAPGAMGDHNSFYDLQNYVAGPSAQGLAVGPDGELDTERSFSRVNYFDVLTSPRVKNNVQPKVSNAPVDFVAVRIPVASFGSVLDGDLRPTTDPILLHKDNDRQTLILIREGGNGMSIRYLPVSGLRVAADGSITFSRRDWAAGFPLKMFEDADLNVGPADRAAWLSEWHTEVEWLRAVHRTKYSNGIIGLIEQLSSHRLFDDDPGLTADERLIRRFRERQRRLAEADMLIMADDMWNFDVKGFNPGGNHGAFFRRSTNSTFMIAGGSETGIPRGLRIDEPYDNLSVAPTLLRLMGRIDADNRPDAGLSALGFRRFPGRVVSEVFGNVEGK